MEKEAALYLNTFEGPSPKDHLCCQITLIYLILWVKIRMRKVNTKFASFEP